MTFEQTLAIEVGIVHKTANDGGDATRQAVAAIIKAVEDSVIGEDEWVMDDEDIGDPAELNDAVDGHTRNELRAHQRNIIRGGGE